MFNQLTENDWHNEPSNDKKIRWQKLASFARSQLLDKGLITVDVRKGVWEITPEGRKALETAGIGDEGGCSLNSTRAHKRRRTNERNRANPGNDQL
jgi:hypothetical protein